MGKFDHFALYSAKHGIGILSYDKSDKPIEVKVNKLDINQDKYLAIDIENFSDVKHRPFAARIAIVSKYNGDPMPGIHTTRKRSHQIVFHALVRLEEYEFKGMREHTHINPHEHNKQPICKRTAPKELVVHYLKDLLNNHSIVWKNINCDLRALYLIGYNITKEVISKIKFYDIERFYKRPDGGQTPLSLEFLVRYVFGNETKEIPLDHSPVCDASNHLRLFNKAINVRKNQWTITEANQLFTSEDSLNKCRIDSIDLNELINKITVDTIDKLSPDYVVRKKKKKKFEIQCYDSPSDELSDSVPVNPIDVAAHKVILHLRLHGAKPPEDDGNPWPENDKNI